VVLEKPQGFTGVLRRSCERRKASSKPGFMNRSWRRTQKPPVNLQVSDSEVGYRSLGLNLRATIASEEPVALSGNSRFVLPYLIHLFHHCHHYREGLREAGSYPDVGSLNAIFLPKQLGAYTPLLRHTVRGLSSLFPAGTFIVRKLATGFSVRLKRSSRMLKKSASLPFI